MRILIVTDAWAPQVSGVVVTLASPHEPRRIQPAEAPV